MKSREDCKKQIKVLMQDKIRLERTRQKAIEEYNHAVISATSYAIGHINAKIKILNWVLI